MCKDYCNFHSNIWYFFFRNLGITTPKYQSEIDEYNRMVAKKKSQDEELASWSTGPKAQQEAPVVDDVRKDENGEKIEMTEK